MKDSDLTRKAIDELLKEMDEHKEKLSLQTERKKNPLGKPNKLFLGRTINSMMKHNKRQTDRNLQRCERKLKELDARKKYKLKKHRKEHYAKLEYSQEVGTSDSSDDEFVSKRRKKKRKKKYRCRSTSSSSTSCSSATTNSSRSLNSSAKSKIKGQKKKRHKTVMEEEYGQIFSNNFSSEPTMGYYVDPNMAYAVMAYSQMNHMMQHQQQQAMVGKDLDETVEIPSDLSLSCSSGTESSLNISLHSSSAEEDENGLVTFKLSSDDEGNVSNITQNTNKNSTKEKKENECDDNESIYSHISLESKDSQISILKETKVYVLTSSDSDELEIVETTQSNSSKKVKTI